ncbi:LysR family transcriptional regulator [Niveispirillum sp. KHB5.9]|uniref:LysR family transcriptional regulator n=1 Tax=Niveispirillum sp. KHB5.9 TaxID=3400269 RepID=UPI003A89256F
MFDIDDIRHIKLIAELGSISQASERLNMSQPTLSKRLARLERHFGIALFHRSNSGMIATEAATYIIGAGEPLFRQIQVIERHIELMATVREGRLSLGVGPIVEQIHLPCVLLDYHRRFPGIRLSVRTGSAEQLMAWLINGELDAAAGPFGDDVAGLAPFHAEALPEEEMVLVVRCGHPLAGRDSLGAGDLTAYPSIGPHIPAHWVHRLGARGVEIVPQITCDNYATSKSLVMASDFITGGPERLFARELADGVLAKLPVRTSIPWSARFVTRVESLHLPAIVNLLAIFKQSSG